MINAHNITVEFGGNPLYSNISFKLKNGDKVGLIGKNGSGKSTLLKVLSGELEYTTGEIAYEKQCSIGFLKQDLEFQEGNTVIEEAYTAFTRIKKIEADLEEINNQLQHCTDYESKSYEQLLHQLDELTHLYELIGGYTYQAETDKILLGLGFKHSDFDKLTDTLSGGWRMRIELAKLLLQNNHVLLLDEPTNHLDIESIVWFENFLKQYTGIIVLVSHDKMFLDTITNRTIEISGKRIYDAPKPYSQFMVYRDELRTNQLQAQKNQEKEIKQTEQLIEKFRYKASKASFAQSLIKKLDKLDRIEVEDEDLARISITFPEAITPGKIILELDSISKSYGEKRVLNTIELLVNRGEKIAFMGQNGQGKSTLAKIIVGAIDDFEGSIKIGHNVTLGYFAQNQADSLPKNSTILSFMEEVASDNNRSKIRDFLGAFLFSGDDVHKKISVLSGGERNRLALCSMLLKPFNFLVMDEPTNHLDITSKNILKNALQIYEGTLIIVSHDRSFLQELTSKTIAFKEGGIREILGSVDHYLQWQQEETSTNPVKKSAKKKGNTNKGKQNTQQKDKEISKVERSISKLENEITTMEKEISENSENVTNNSEFFKTYQQKKEKLDGLFKQWEVLH